VLIMSSFFIFPNRYYNFILVIFIFFVGEALVLLSSLYNLLRNTGFGYRRIVLS